MEFYLTTLSSLTTIDLSSCLTLSKDKKLIIFSKKDEVPEMTASSLASIIGAKNLTAEVVIINSEADIIFKLGYLSATRGKTDKIYSMLPDEINLSKEILETAGVYTYSIEKKKKNTQKTKSTKSDGKINTDSSSESETNNKTGELSKEAEANIISKENNENTSKEIKTNTSSKKETNLDKESVEKIKKYLKDVVEPDKIEELAVYVRDALVESIMMDDKMGALVCKGKIAKVYGKEVGNIIADKYRILKGQL